MKIDWRQFSHVAAAIVGVVVPGVREVEQIAWNIGGMAGREKQDAVVQMVRQALAAANGLTEKTLADDEDVEKATRGVVDAVVALNKIIARKASAPKP